MTDPAAPPRVAGRLGRLPAKPPHLRFPIPWAHQLLAAPLPVPVYPIDLRGGAGPGQIWGNNTKGDCGVAGVLFTRLYTAWRAAEVPMPSWTDAQAIGEYLLYTGGVDVGVVLADFLLWLYRRGEILGFAPAPHHDPTTCHALMAATGTPLVLGVSLTDNDQHDFGVRPWGSGGVIPDPRLGHCVNYVYTDGALHEQVRTWAAFQDVLPAWSAGCIDEGWLLITTDEQKALFTPALWAILDSLPGATGSPPPFPPAPPNPGGPPPRRPCPGRRLLRLLGPQKGNR